MKQYQKYLLTGAVVLIAIVLVLFKYWDYVANPWTRDGQVQANVIQLTPRVSGPIINLPIKDNQFVKAGDLLFKIDPRTFEASLAEARAQLDATGYDVRGLEKQVDASRAALEMSRTSIRQAQSAIKELDAQIIKNAREYDRQKTLLSTNATSQKAVDRVQTTYEVSVQQREGSLAGLLQARASVRQAEAELAKAQAELGEIGDSNAQVRAALASVRQAELNLEFTEVRAPVDGYITNLKLRKGTQAIANTGAVALVDVNSYWVYGFFKETLVGDMNAGDDAVVTLMSYPDTPLKGKVESLGWGISQSDGSAGYELLPTVAPTFEWIRLAQRIPVRIHLIEVPEHIKLRVGTTASVLIKSKSSTSE